MTNQQKIWKALVEKKIIKFDDCYKNEKERRGMIQYVSALNKADIVSFTRKTTTGRGVDTITLLKLFENAPLFSSGILKTNNEEIYISKNSKLAKQSTKEKLLKETIFIILKEDTDKFRVGDIFESVNVYKRWLDLLEYNNLLIFESRYRNSKIYIVPNIEELKNIYNKLLHVRDWRIVLKDNKK